MSLTVITIATIIKWVQFIAELMSFIEHLTSDH
jgi:hypothetical protein